MKLLIYAHISYCINKNKYIYKEIETQIKIIY